MNEIEVLFPPLGLQVSGTAANRNGRESKFGSKAQPEMFLKAMPGLSNNPPKWE